MKYNAKLELKLSKEEEFLPFGNVNWELSSTNFVKMNQMEQIMFVATNISLPSGAQ